MKKTYISALLIGLTSTVGFSQAVQQKKIHHIESLNGGNDAPATNAPTYTTKALGVQLWSDNFSNGANWTAASFENPTGGSMGTVLPTFGWEIGTTSNSWWTTNGFATGINGSAGGFAEVNNGNYNTNNQAINVTYTLTSQVFDVPNLPGNTGNVDGIMLTFKQFGALFNDAQTVEITTDGTTWEEVFTNDGREAFVGNNPTTIYANPETINVNLAPWTIGNASQVQIRFKWTSGVPTLQTLSAWTTFGWYIDDVSISTLPDNEFKLGKSWHGDIVNDWEYSMLPLTQSREMIAGVVVSNDGATDANAVVSCDIFKDNVSISSPADITQMIPAGVTDTIWFNTGYTPNANGVYHVEFSIPTDDIPTNNTSETNTLTINDDLMAHDYGSTSQYGWNPLSTNATVVQFAESEHAWGQIYFPTVTAPVYGMDIFLGSNTTPNIYLLAQVYEYDPSLSIQNQTMQEMAAVEINTTATNLNKRLNILFNQPVNMTVGKGYIFQISNPSPATGEALYVAGTGSNNEDDDFAAVGYGDLANPSAGLLYFSDWGHAFYIRPNFRNTAGISENEIISSLNVYPNPATDNISVNFNLANTSNVTIEIVDVTGKVSIAKTLTNQAAGQSNVSFETGALNSGVYFVNISTEAGKATQKFIKK